VPFSASFETTLRFLPDDAARAAYCAERGATSSIDKIVAAGRKALHLQAFFTCGADEVRSWTVRENTKAPSAAGVIHTDFAIGFIKAEIYSIDDLKQALEDGTVTPGGGPKAEATVKASGKLRTEGKTYLMADGDVVLFKIGQVNPKKK
jgi:obg-like ATPase 1